MKKKSNMKKLINVVDDLYSLVLLEYLIITHWLEGWIVD